MAVELSGYCSFEAALDLPRRFAFCFAAGGVGAGLLVGAQANQDDGVECSVELAVSGVVEAVSDGLTAAGWDGCSSGE